MNINDNDVCLTRNEKRNIAALLCRSILVENFQPFWKEDSPTYQKFVDEYGITDAYELRSHGAE
jgi:hypothetical protein